MQFVWTNFIMNCYWYTWTQYYLSNRGTFHHPIYAVFERESFSTPWHLVESQYTFLGETLHRNKSTQQNILFKMERKLHVPECMYRNAIISIIVSDIRWYSTTDIYSVENNVSMFFITYSLYFLTFIFFICINNGKDNDEGHLTEGLKNSHIAG